MSSSCCHAAAEAGSRKPNPSSGSGQIMLTLQIDETQTRRLGSRTRVLNSTASATISTPLRSWCATHREASSPEGGPFNCVDGTATLSVVQAGRDYTVQVNALDQEGFTIFSGEVTGVTVLANRIDYRGTRQTPAGDEPEAADDAAHRR